jgi:hypothetical protein
MEKVGLKLFQVLDYETFEPLQYWLDYDFEYDDLVEAIENDQIIELDLEEDEDREEDIEMLQVFLKKFQDNNIEFKTYLKQQEWREEEFVNIC